MMRMRIPAEFFHKHKIDITLLQEFTDTDFGLIGGYIAYTNVGINKRGSPMLTRQTIKLTDTTRFPSGRGIAGFA
jgi:hypothetical protein